VILRKWNNAAQRAEEGALEHHGLNRCLDVGLEGYARYVGMGVPACNLHFIGRRLREKRGPSAKAARTRTLSVMASFLIS